MEPGLLRSLAFPQMLDRRDNIELRHTNTCQWILELDEYQSWTNQPRGLLWIKGKPGAGKSTLMVFLHDRLKGLQDGSQGIWLDFFFSARGTEMQRTPLGMLRSLLNQIFDRDATIRPQVREIYEQRCRQFGYGECKWQWPKVVLEELLASAILASASHQHVTVFVDALDEAGAESAQQLAVFFHRLVDRKEKNMLALQICISCRHYPIIESAQAIAIYVENHNQEDIATYVNDMLTDTESGDGPSQETREVLVEELTRQANGVFQWAHLIMPITRQRLLEGESINDIRCWLREVPAGLEEVYTYILSNVILARNREQSLLFFQWVCLAERPLTVLEMRYALVAQNVQITPSRRRWETIHGFVESNERMKRRIKALAGGLAEVVSSGHQNETVQVVHQSVNDFMRAKGLGFLLHSISASTSIIDGNSIVPRCHAVLYRSCLFYLATGHISGKLSDFQGTREDFVRDCPFIKYATFNLFIHAEKAADSRVDLLQNETKILQQIISLWAGIYRDLDEWGPASPPTGTKVLHMAAATNLVDLIESLISSGEDIEIEDENGNTALHYAARSGNTTAGKILQEKGADQEAKDKDGATPLIEAARCGHLKFVEWLLHEGVVVQAGEGGALQAASSSGHNAIVEILLGAGADANAQGGTYGNALQAAAWQGNTETVKILLDAHADVNAQGGEYGNALQAAAAAYNRSTETVKMLLDAHADVDAQGGEFGNVLQAAAWRGNTETVKILLDAHADVHTQGGQYSNTLQAAAWRGNTETVKILLDAHADVNAQGGEFGNALQAAAWRGKTETVKILLNAHADIHTQGGKYGNALQAAAAAYNRSTEIVKMLLDAHADVHTQGGQYGNALQAAAWRGNTGTVKILLDAHADVNAQGGEFGNALQAATWRGDTETAKILLDAHADVNSQGGILGNALQAAAWRGNTETVKILLDANADIHAQGGEFGNALQAAASQGNTETVKILLDANADIHAQGGESGNALQAAASQGNTETVKILLDANADVHAQGGRFGNALQAAASQGNTKIVKILLDAHADFNARGGEYGSPLLAAIHWGHPDAVQIILHAGGDALLADELDQTPLHIAASRDMLHILFRFTQLASAINNRNKFLQTPLHLAVSFGHIKFAIALLHLGADPSLPDGYGKNIMDWALGNETLVQEIRKHCPHLTATPHETQKSTVRRSLFQLSDMLPRLRLDYPWPVLQQLGRYYLFLNDMHNARHLFQVHLSQSSSLPADLYRAICNFCNMPITGTRFVCRVCAHMDLCSSCLEKHPFHSRLQPNQRHEVFEVSAVPDNESQLTGLASERLTLFLSNLSHESLGGNTYRSEIEPSNDPVSCLARKQIALVSEASTLSLVATISAIFCGVVATLLGLWYFEAP
jgi:ankyrin repeat protein/adenylate kinase family enzyme